MRLFLFILFLNIATFGISQVGEPEIESEVMEEVEVEMVDSPPPPSPVGEKPNAAKEIPTSAYYGQQNGRYGFYNNQDWFVPPVYDELDKVFSDFMVAKKSGKYGMIDRLNNIVIPFEYDKIFKLNKPYKRGQDREWLGLYRMEKDGKMGMMDKTGKITIPVKYSVVGIMEENIYSLGSEELGYGLVDQNHKILIPFKYDSPLQWVDKKQKIFQTQIEKKIGWIDLKDQVVLPFEYEELKMIGYPKVRYYEYMKNGKWGFMDLNGKILVGPVYDGIVKRAGQIILVGIDDKIGVIKDNDFKEIIPPVFDKTEKISQKYLMVQVGRPFGRAHGVIDTLGNIILDTLYQDRIKAGPGNLIFAKAKTERRVRELYAVYNEKGTQIIPPTFSYVNRRLNYMVVATNLMREHSDSDKALMNSKGEIITPYIYSEIRLKKKRGTDTYIIHAERDDMKGTLSADGTENPDFVPTNKKKQQQDQNLRNEKQIQTAFEQLQGEWYGLNTSGFLTKIQFLSPEMAICTVYFLKDGEECSFDYAAAVSFLPSMNKIKVQPQSRYKELRCTQPSKDFLAIKDQLYVNGLFDYSLKTAMKNFTLLHGYSKKTTPKNVTDSNEVLKKIKIFKEIEKELSAKIESKPGGIQRCPKFEISITTNEIFLHSYSRYLFGKMENVKGEYLFKPLQWAGPEMTYSLSGILRNIRYLDASGKIKTGDLDIGFSAFDKTPYYFKEL